MRNMACGRCGQRVFFDNTACESCGAALGFVPAEMQMGSFEIDGVGCWQRVDGGAEAQKPCSHYNDTRVCNWMLPAGSADELCLSCRTTIVIPPLGKPGNQKAWARIEQAKRRLFYGLMSLHLPFMNMADDPRNGLSFQFLEATPARHNTLTGHAAGVITLNIAEADDVRREQLRTSLHEPTRTLLGHLRHEIGHYFWDRLFRNDPARLERFRQRFGDERMDYSQALQQHYAARSTDWWQRYVSAYASAHPWEDWAECWAHYLHIQDALETAAAWGLHLGHALPDGSGAPTELHARPLTLAQPLAPQLIEQWLPVSQFINAMDRSLGASHSYPFVLPPPVVDKLELIHEFVGLLAQRSGSGGSAAEHEAARSEPQESATA